MIRQLYRLLLRLHPLAFRDRFAREMLWIFDQAHQPVSYLADALVSLIRQHAHGDPGLQPALAGFGLLDKGSAISPRRLAEATLAATLLLATMLLLLAHPPRLLTLPACPAGTPGLAARPIQAPSRIRPLAAAAKTPSASAQVNSSVAGALRVLRAQSSPPTGFCVNP